ncbi:MAG: ABC transporter permease [Firmicutes bacterium]|nr:ABC transporter permease [Bacillota bacterium]
MKTAVKNKSGRSLNQKNMRKIINAGFIALMLTLTYIPIIMIVIFSFTQSRSFGDWNSYKFTFALFEELFEDAEIMRSLGNSLFIGLVASLLATVIGTFSVIGLFYSRKKIRAAIEYSGQITMFNADIVTALSMAVFFAFLSIKSDYVRLILAHTVICLPYVIMSIMPRLYQLNPNVYEAGLDLGAPPARTLLTVILPQLIGGMIAGFALAFTISMDDFTITMFVSNLDTIPTYLYTKLRLKSIMPQLRALSAVLMAAVMAVLAAVNIFSARKNKKSQKLAAQNRV